jgi:hypothetical protein
MVFVLSDNRMLQFYKFQNYNMLFGSEIRRLTY